MTSRDQELEAKRDRKLLRVSQIVGVIVGLFVIVFGLWNVIKPSTPITTQHLTVNINESELAMAAFNVLKQKIESLSVDNHLKAEFIRSQQKIIGLLLLQRSKENMSLSVKDAFEGILKQDLTKVDAILKLLIKSHKQDEDINKVELIALYQLQGDLWIASDTERAKVAYQNIIEIDPNNNQRRKILHEDTSFIELNAIEKTQTIPTNIKGPQKNTNSGKSICSLVGSFAHLPPVHYFDPKSSLGVSSSSGKPSGFDVELFSMVAKKVAKTDSCSIVYLDPKNRRANKYVKPDFLLGWANANRKYPKVTNYFSLPYRINKLKLYVWANRQAVTSQSSVSIFVQENFTLGHLGQYIDEIELSHLMMDYQYSKYIKRYNDAAIGYKGLEVGEIDGFLAYSNNASKMLHALGFEHKIIAHQNAKSIKSNVYIIFNQRVVTLAMVRSFNVALKEVMQTEKYELLVKKYQK